MSRLNKTLVALGIALFFTFGAFALSDAAHDSRSAWPFHSLELHGVLKTGDIQIIHHAVHYSVTLETGNLPSSSQTDWAGLEPSPTRVVDPALPLTRSQPYAAKVSLQILQSVLNL